VKRAGVAVLSVLYASLGFACTSSVPSPEASPPSDAIVSAVPGRPLAPLIPAGVFAEVRGPFLDVRPQPTAASPLTDVLEEAGFVYVVGGFNDETGTAWQRVEYFSERPEPLFGWVPVAPGGDARLAPIRMGCPTRDLNLLTVIGAMTPPEHLRCFGDRPLVIGPVRAEVQKEPPIVRGDPGWLSERASILLTHDGDGVLEIHVDPASKLSVPLGRWLEVVGHFDHRASATCQRRIPANSTFSQETDDESRLWCRQQFVVTAVRLIPTRTR
jgi:hypothetical protein